jgi:hypothetical protein
MQLQIHQQTVAGPIAAIASTTRWQYLGAIELTAACPGDPALPRGATRNRVRGGIRRLANRHAETIRGNPDDH